MVGVGGRGGGGSIISESKTKMSPRTVEKQ